MQIQTSRFGFVEIDPSDILVFPAGLAAFEKHLHWVLLADGESDALAWLQSISDAETAFPVVSPRRFAPDYQIRIARNQMAPLQFSDADQAYVLTIVGKNDRGLTLNLKAPLVLNLDRRIGRQVITNDDQEIQFPLRRESGSLRQSA